MAKYLTLLAVGDSESSKTELLLKYTGAWKSANKRYNEFVVPKFYDNVQDIIVDWVPYTVCFMDAESSDHYEILRKEAYLQADCILLCYSVANKTSFKNIYKKWCLEIRRVAPFVPLILVATNTEARNNNESMISAEQGENLKLLIGAYAFVECSIKNFLGVDDIFIEAVRSTYPRK